MDYISHSLSVVQRAVRLKQYCIKVLGIFGFEFKDFLLSGEDNEKIPMLKDGICFLGGYIIVIVIVKTFGQDWINSLEAVSDIFKGVPKTIRFLLYNGGLCYDPHGLIIPLRNQLRYVTSRIIKKLGLNYDQEI